MKSLIIVMMIVCTGCHLSAQEISNQRKLEISSGFSGMLYQSVYSFQESIALETALRGQAIGLWDWQVGARLGFKPTLPEGFVRLLAVPEIGAWRPSVGIELGLTNRSHFDEGETLLRETRKAMEHDISHIYIAGHSTPVSFLLWNRWRISVMELNIGTHVGDTGRTMRVQIGILSVGRTI